MNDGQSISQQISQFETAYARFYSRCASSSRPEAVALRSFLSVDQVKAMYLFLSLPYSFNNIIDNLTTKEDLIFADVNRRLLDLNSIKPIDTPSNSKAYFGNNSPSNDKIPLECNYCRKHGVNYKDHVHNKCRKLQVYLEQKSKSKGKAKIKLNKSNAAVIPDENITDIIDSDKTYNKAFLSGNTRLSSSWVLDSGCSAHMTSQKDSLKSLQNHNGVVTLVNGNKILIEGKGDIFLNLRTSTGDKMPATIRNVLYVPNLKGGNLISKIQLELDGNLIISENGHRRVFFKNKKWMLAVLDSSKQIFIQENKYKTFFTSYLEAHQCFGHPRESVMSNLRKQYPQEIPNKPEGFSCPACILAKSTHKSESTKQRKSLTI